jgi:hypothetical protein
MSASESRPIFLMFNTVFPRVPGAPTMQHCKGVLLETYSQKTIWKGTNFRHVCKKNESQSQKLAKIFRFLNSWSEIGQFLKSLKIFLSGFCKQ